MRSTASIAAVGALVLTLALFVPGCISENGSSFIPTETGIPQTRTATSTTTAVTSEQSPATPPSQTGNDSFSAGYGAGQKECSRTGGVNGTDVFNLGYDAGYDAGYEAGYQEGLQAIQESLGAGPGF